MNFFDTLSIGLVGEIIDESFPDAPIIKFMLSLICKTLHHHFRTSLPGKKLTEYCANNGLLNLLDWATQHGCPCDFAICSQIAGHRGNIDILEWLTCRGHEFFLDLEMCKKAVTNGNLKLIKWEEENCGHEHFIASCTFFSNTGWLAAGAGQLEILKWVRKNFYRLDHRVCSSAARGGHLEILQWARQNEINWTETTCASAARGGHLEILKWARYNGCNWTETTCASAAKGGHLEILQWARNNYCAWCPKLVQMLQHGVI